MKCSSHIFLLAFAISLIGAPLSCLNGQQLGGHSLRSQTVEKEHGYRVAERLLIAEVPVSLVPRREYAIAAPESGVIELFEPTNKTFHQAGTQLGGVNLQRIEADEKLLSLEETRFKAKEIPEWHLTQLKRNENLERQLETLNAQMILIDEILAAPEDFEAIVDYTAESGGAQQTQLKANIAELEEQLTQVEAVIAYAGSEQPEKLELEAQRIQLELKRTRFDDRYREAHLTVPFDGVVELHYPYVEGEVNYVTAGQKIATVRDLKQVYAAMPVLDSNWRQIAIDQLEITVGTAEGKKDGRFLKQIVEINSGREGVIYFFDFADADYPALTGVVGGEINGWVYQLLDEKCLIVPKLEIVAKSPESFKKGGWVGLVETVMPGHRFVDKGLNAIAISRRSASQDQ